MKITELIWLTQFVEKIESKHGVTTDEVEEVLQNTGRVQRVERGGVAGEHLTGSRARRTPGGISSYSSSIKAAGGRW